MMQRIKKLLEPNTLLLLALGYTLLITVAFLLPGKSIPPTGLPLDKFVHIAIHAGLSFIWSLFFFKRRNKIDKKTMLVILIACLFYGIIIETIQEYWISLRHADGWDLVANCTGMLLGTLLFHKTQTYFRNQI